MENNKKGKKHIWDKIIMGAVIGGAIGSVVGASIAPQKGKETRREIVETAKKTTGKFKKIFNFFRKLIGKKHSQSEFHKETQKEIIKKIPNETLTKTTFSQAKEKANHDQ